jgi:hypothetical protein
MLQKGDGMKKLELHRETLRDLTEVDLSEAVGGASTTNCPKVTTLLTMTQTPACPSGATWFAPCESEGMSCNCS